MTAMIVRWLRRAAIWLWALADHWDETVVPVADRAPAQAQSPAPDPLDRRAADLVARAERLAGTSGEYRRHWVYARLVKAFPDRPKRDAGMAIERALAARGDAS